jgi:hypothetical protein
MYIAQKEKLSRTGRSEKPFVLMLLASQNCKPDSTILKYEIIKETLVSAQEKQISGDGMSMIGSWAPFLPK